MGSRSSTRGSHLQYRLRKLLARRRRTDLEIRKVRRMLHKESR